MNGTLRYTIRPYDTIWMLAQVFNTTVDSIMMLNPGIDPRNLQIGQVVSIRPGLQYYPTIPGGATRNGNVGNGMTNNNGIMDNGMTNNNGMANNNGMMDNGMMDNGTMNNGMMDDDMMGEEMIFMDDVEGMFRMLWEQHVAWTTMAIVSILNDLPETELVLKRLLRNATDFADVFAQYYDEESALEFGGLLTDHLTIAAELVRAAKAGDNETMTQADQRWRQNANLIAEYLGSVNPYWSVDDWSAMMNEHLDLLSESVADSIAGNYEKVISGFDDIEMQALEMADMMAEGIIMQFPD